MPLNYECLGEVRRVYSDVPVSLRLQRIHGDGPDPYYALSWRTRYSSGANRRFYWISEGFWTIPTNVSRDILEEAAAKGMLDHQFDDPFVRVGSGPESVVYSFNLFVEPRKKMFEEITTDEDRMSWGTNPTFVAVTQPTGVWRKVMLIDTKHSNCTFRSLTVVPGYKPIRLQGCTSPWRLDNAMQDASAFTMRTYVQALRRLH